jgi:hypothetical protein
VTATHDVGPLGEEAARLVEALAGWARDHTGGTGEADAGGSGPAIGGAAECQLCPVCQAIALLRHARPETFAHLLEASAALTAALRSLVETHTQPPSGGVQRIDLDDDGEYGAS